MTDHYILVFDEEVTVTNGQAITVEYDTKGRPVKVIGPDGKPIPFHLEEKR